MPTKPRRTPDRHSRLRNDGPRALLRLPGRPDAPRLPVTPGRHRHVRPRPVGAFGGRCHGLRCQGTVTDWHDLIARDDVDVVDICTPPGTHAEIAQAAAAAGKAVSARSRWRCTTRRHAPPPRRAGRRRAQRRRLQLPQAPGGRADAPDDRQKARSARSGSGAQPGCRTNSPTPQPRSTGASTALWAAPRSPTWAVT